LEFDTVIVAGLGRPDKVDDPPLVLFHEWAEGGVVERLIASMPEQSGPGPGGTDALYEYLRKIESRKSGLERVRALYVAATRAKKNLHLLGQAKVNKNGELAAEARSMLGDLWNALTDEERARFVRSAADHEAAQPVSAEAATSGRWPASRLPVLWAPPELPTSLAPPAQAEEVHAPTFAWVGETLRIAGTVVHEALRRVRGGTVEIPRPQDLQRLLVHAGVAPADMWVAQTRVTEALARMRESPRARWILADHRDARSEVAIAGVDRGEIVHGKVDRTFVDQDGVRWIVDFKTAAHQGGSLEQFLNEQQRRYRDQLERYARLFAPLGQRVRLGLYFPLLDEWREWEALDFAQMNLP
jgi:ATP-dependent exoDNAse (exonuclease V) beta subunit